MTVKELIKLLQQENPDDLVILSRDEEGNGFNTVHGISKNTYQDGDISIRELTPELINKGYCEDDLCRGNDCKNCIVIWP